MLERAGTSHCRVSAAAGELLAPASPHIIVHARDHMHINMHMHIVHGCMHTICMHDNMVDREIHSIHTYVDEARNPRDLLHAHVHACIASMQTYVYMYYIHVDPYRSI